MKHIIKIQHLASDTIWESVPLETTKEEFEGKFFNNDYVAIQTDENGEMVYLPAKLLDECVIYLIPVEVVGENAPKQKEAIEDAEVSQTDDLRLPF